ncbi:MAG: hypothetical protein VKL58_06665 [Cyanobacteriota bacterium]|nr:hypothetical protein [Cyanobacteriota bacterium]
MLSPLPALVLLLGLAAPAALAQPVGPNLQELRLTPAQRQKVFPEQRRLALQDHQARMAILQRGERCIEKAANAELLRTCMREEREAMRQQRSQHMERLKALYQRNGLPTPPWLMRREGPQRPGGDWGGGEV